MENIIAKTAFISKEILKKHSLSWNQTKLEWPWLGNKYADHPKYNITMHKFVVIEQRKLQMKTFLKTHWWKLYKGS